MAEHELPLQVVNTTAADETPQDRADRLVVDLARLLNQENVDLVMDLGNHNWLSSDQIDMLRRLHHHFRQEVADAEVEDGEGHGPGRRDRRPAHAKKQPEMLRLASSVVLGDELRRFVANEQNTPVIFLAGDVASEDISNFPTKLQEGWNQQRMNLAFLAAVNYLNKLNKRNEMDRARQVFMWLSFYDLTQMLNENNETEHTGRRMGDRMKEATLTHISGDFYTGVLNRPEEAAMVKQKVEVYTRRGLKLAQLCEEFGEGVLFILAPKLSEDMVDKKYVESMDSPIHIQTFDKLKAEGLVELGNVSGATKLGREIRKFMKDGWAKCNGREV